MGREWEKWTKEMLESKPKSYGLPPKEADIGYNKYMEAVTPRSATSEREYGYMLRFYQGVRHYFGLKPGEGQAGAILREAAMADKRRNAEEGHVPIPLNIYIEEAHRLHAEDLINYPIDKFKDDGLTLSNSYKDIMNGGTIRTVSKLSDLITRDDVSTAPSEQDRAQGRDNWKDLGIEGQGVPQGLGSSPFLSTILTDRYLEGLKDNILMYMDDGLLFANSEEEMEEIKDKLKRGLEEMGIELEPSKSHDVRIDGEWQRELKFLGLVYNPDDNTMRSKTRAGTELKFPLLHSWKEIQKAVPEIMDISPYIYRSRLDKLVNETAHEAAIAHGFLGAMISESMIPISEEEYSRRYEIARTKILTGQGKAAAEIRASATDKCFIWKFQDLWPIDSLQVQATDPIEINLMTMSSIACIKFLKATKRDPLVFLRTSETKSRKRVKSRIKKGAEEKA